MASALAMDKWRTKLLWQAAGITTPHHILINEQSDFAKVAQELGLPLDRKARARGVDHRLEQGGRRKRFTRRMRPRGPT